MPESETSEPQAPRRRYRIEAEREGIDITFADDFWETEDAGFDERVARLADEVRIVVYALAIGSLTRH